MAFQPPEIVAELGHPLLAGGELKRGQDGLVDLNGTPPAQQAPTMQQHLEQTDEAGVVNLQAWISHRADLNRQGDPLQLGEVDVNVQPLCPMGGEATGNLLESFADRVQVIKVFLEPEIGQVVGADLIAGKM